MPDFNEYTQIVSVEEGLVEYNRNPAFRECLEAGRFAYVEGVFVFNDPLLVADIDGKLMLTDFANKNLDKFTLSFGVIKASKQTEELFESQESLECPDNLECTKKEKPGTHKHFDLRETKARIEADISFPSEIKEEWLAEVRQFECQFMYDHTCWRMIGSLLKENHTTPGDFERRTLLSKRTYYRAVKDEHEQPPKMSTIITIAAGYGFDLPLTKKLLELAGLALSPADPEHRAYEFIIRAMKEYTIHEKNKLLADSGLKLLGDEEH